MPRKRLMMEAVAAARTAPEPAPTSPAPAPRPRGLDPLAGRQSTLADLAEGRVRDVRLRLIDPKTCRMWARHNRLYDRLTPADCDDLISSIRAQGRQEIPAVVRRLANDPGGFEYEVIAGARRHFAVSYLREEEHRDVRFLVEVRELEDEEAFRFSDLENRGRKDISDYERGREYLVALEHYYGGNQTRMAERMEVSKALLSSYLAVAKLPAEVVAAYEDPREIAVRHGQQLSPLLNGPGRQALLGRAGVIAETQASFKAHGAPILPGAEVFKLLKAEGASKQVAIPFGRVGGKPVLTAVRTRNKLRLDVDLRAGEEAILNAVTEALRVG
jgi:ParB family chromosome partitioning protein